jgi:hypothetical protein
MMMMMLLLLLLPTIMMTVMATTAASVTPAASLSLSKFGFNLRRQCFGGFLARCGSFGHHSW